MSSSLSCTCVFLRSPTPAGRGKIHNALQTVARRVFGSDGAADNFAAQLLFGRPSLSRLISLESAKRAAAIWFKQGAVEPKLLEEGEVLPTWSDDDRSSSLENLQHTGGYTMPCGWAIIIALPAAAGGDF